MKHLPLALALLVFLAVALGFYLERPEPADASLFGSEMALAPELPPLVMPRGTLSLSGRVRAADGSDAADTLVALLRGEDDPSLAEPLYHAYTDAAGRFALGGVEAGNYRVLLSHPSAPPKTFALELPLEGEASWTLADPLPPLPLLPELRRTARSGHLRAPAGLTLHGQSGSDPLQGFEVVLRPAKDVPMLAGATERRAATDTGGTFALGELVAAHYEVEVLPPWARGGSWPILGRGAMDATEEAATDFELALDVGALAGSLTEPEGRPLPGALVKVSALDARDAGGEPELWPAGVTDADGRFGVELLPPGRYRLHFRAGAAARDLEVMVESGRVTEVPAVTLDPRAQPAPAGG